MLCFVAVDSLRLTMLSCTLLSVLALLSLLLIFKRRDGPKDDSFVVQWAILPQSKCNRHGQQSNNCTVAHYVVQRTHMGPHILVRPPQCSHT
jgi:hypothetical protein